MHRTFSFLAYFLASFPPLFTRLVLPRGLVFLRSSDLMFPLRFSWYFTSHQVTWHTFLSSQLLLNYYWFLLLLRVPRGWRFRGFVFIPLPNLLPLYFSFFFLVAMTKTPHNWARRLFFYFSLPHTKRTNTDDDVELTHGIKAVVTKNTRSQRG